MGLIRCGAGCGGVVIDNTTRWRRDLALEPRRTLTELASGTRSLHRAWNVQCVGHEPHSLQTASTQDVSCPGCCGDSRVAPLPAIPAPTSKLVSHRKHLSRNERTINARLSTNGLACILDTSTSAGAGALPRLHGRRDVTRARRERGRSATGLDIRQGVPTIASRR